MGTSGIKEVLHPSCDAGRWDLCKGIKAKSPNHRCLGAVGRLGALVLKGIQSNLGTMRLRHTSTVCLPIKGVLQSMSARYVDALMSRALCSANSINKQNSLIRLLCRGS